MVSDNLKQVLLNIHEVCGRRGRDPGEITLVGVTKFAEVPAINAAIVAGLLHIAENRVQLAEAKFPKIDYAGKPVVRHLIGHLQSNKARDAVRLFDLIQSVDSIKLADEINKRAAAIGKIQDILIQVDIAKEEQKFGLPEAELAGAVAYLDTLPNVRLLGLMTMAPLTQDKDVVRGVFRRAKEFFDQLKAHGAPLTILSMGMSSDYEIALEEGATMVRIGSAIFK